MLNWQLSCSKALKHHFRTSKFSEKERKKKDLSYNSIKSEQATHHVLDTKPFEKKAQNLP